MVLYKIDWSLKITACEVVKETPKTFKVQNGRTTNTVRKVDLGSFDGVYVCYALSIADLKKAYRKRTAIANETLSKRIKTNNDNLNIVCSYID